MVEVILSSVEAEHEAYWESAKDLGILGLLEYSHENSIRKYYELKGEVEFETLDAAVSWLAQVQGELEFNREWVISFEGCTKIYARFYNGYDK